MMEMITHCGVCYKPLSHCAVAFVHKEMQGITIGCLSCARSFGEGAIVVYCRDEDGKWQLKVAGSKRQ
jgi:hypothetical protein